MNSAFPFHLPVNFGVIMRCCPLPSLIHMRALGPHRPLLINTAQGASKGYLKLACSLPPTLSSVPMVQSSFWDETSSEINTFSLSVETFCLPVRREEENVPLYYMETAISLGLTLSRKCYFFRCLCNRNNKASTGKATGYFLAKLHMNGLFQKPKEQGGEQVCGPQQTAALPGGMAR